MCKTCDLQTYFAKVFEGVSYRSKRVVELRYMRCRPECRTEIAFTSQDGRADHLSSVTHPPEEDITAITDGLLSFT